LTLRKEDSQARVVRSAVRLARDGEQLHVFAQAHAGLQRYVQLLLITREKGEVVFDGPQVAAKSGRVELVAGGVPIVDP
jgi:hypothetical protein